MYRDLNESLDDLNENLQSVLEIDDLISLGLKIAGRKYLDNFSEELFRFQETTGLDLLSIQARNGEFIVDESNPFGRETIERDTQEARLTFEASMREWGYGQEWQSLIDNEVLLRILDPFEKLLEYVNEGLECGDFPGEICCPKTNGDFKDMIAGANMFLQSESNTKATHIQLTDSYNFINYCQTMSNLMADVGTKVQQMEDYLEELKYREHLKRPRRVKRV